jgi:hypothetical protein
MIRTTATARSAAFEIPRTISGLWALCALVPPGSRRAYEEAADLCTRLSVRRLTAVQREYFHELLELVEAWEDEHDETGKTLRSLSPKARA